jgi:hypothetical protein
MLKFRNYFVVGAFILSLFANSNTLLAQGQRGHVNNDKLLVPSSSWLVGPASILPEKPDKSGHIACIMMNQFNNGIDLKMSIRQQKVLALAIDFKDSLFEPGQSYKARFSVEGSDFSQDFVASAYSKYSLIINTYNSLKLFDAVSKGRSLDISIGNSILQFALLGAKDGIKRVEKCSSASNKGAPDNRAQLFEPFAADKKALALDSIDDKPRVKAAPLIEVEAIELAGSNRSEGSISKVNDSRPEIAWVIGSDDKDVKNYAADKIGVLRSNLSTEDALKFGIPIKKPDYRSWVRKSRSKKLLTGAKKDFTDYSKRNDGEENPVYTKKARWRAGKGANIKEVLEVWAKYAGAEVIWKSDQDFVVKEPLVVEGSFEKAVMAVLYQYNEDKIRPVGEIYDAGGASGKAVFTIDSSNSY